MKDCTDNLNVNFAYMDVLTFSALTFNVLVLVKFCRAFSISSWEYEHVNIRYQYIQTVHQFDELPRRVELGALIYSSAQCNFFSFPLCAT